ncbi:WD40-repeat-containing domain protein [Podospora australis]|uniref:WD40-repeat-containing domain protein n=1 Tax=Podospora australis TaxID=1536484 RepID=A0AAN7ANR5_9PEZI|nr:WD40-repeat-containing domain protein [Podospora australis]
MPDKTPSTKAKRSATLGESLLSSPPRAPSSLGKERRNPSITPRKFQRFFTPRSRVSSKPSAARRALREITATDLSNRSQTPSSPLKPISEEQIPDELPDLQSTPRGSKRRRLVENTPLKQSSHLPSPLATSPALLPTSGARPGLSSPIRHIKSRGSRQLDVDVHDGVFEDEEEDQELEIPKRVIPFHTRGLGGKLVQRLSGDIKRGCPVPDWRTETADFYSRPEDLHVSTSHLGEPRAIPFCATSFHKSTMVAVGDEEGFVRLLDTDSEFSKIHQSFQVHGNAVIDLVFSEDDHLLATASGDQTGRVVDMTTQTPVAVLGRHTASVKQVRFQPGRGEGCVLATSARDGSIQIWDLRCRGGPVQDIVAREDGLRHGLPKPVNPGCVVNSIYDAHARTQRQTKAQSRSSAANSSDVARVGEVPGRIGEVSVTALQFLPTGREHLLLSACEADAMVKLWDIRAVHTSRHHKTATPLSYTAPPASHAWRPFGISAMTLNTDGSRLYAVSKDNTVYAYSTAHLMLGHGPELTPALPGTEPPRRRHHPHGLSHEGLGPLYGFRHPMFHAASFYVKAAIRPARDGRSELLAVGSSDRCAVLFPTDERYLQESWARSDSGGEEIYYVGESTAMLPTPSGGSRPGLRSAGSASLVPGLSRSNSASNLFARQADSTPFSRRGTPLVRGHEMEVGALTWTTDGKLVTVSDDYSVRCWRSGREQASDLRTGGEGEGRRWGCGWADVGDAWEGDQADW